MPNRYLPPQQQQQQQQNQKADSRLRAFGTSPGRPPAVLTRVCCVGGGAKCSQSSGDSSPEPTGRYAAAANATSSVPPPDSTYRSWRGGESGDYWHVEQPGGSSGALSCVAATAGGYETINRSHQQPQQQPTAAPATFHLRPDQPASFCLMSSSAVADQQYRPHPQSFQRPNAQAGDRLGRGSSAEPPRHCDDIVKPVRLGSSVPSSPSSSGGGSRLPLWGSFRGGNKKTPLLEKRQCSPHVKTAS